MAAVKVLITRFLGYDPQPGSVEFELVDASGRTHTFIEKIAIVSGPSYPDAHLDSYPLADELDCTILDRRTDASGREVVTISTEKPWGVFSTEEVTEFEILADQLTELSDPR